MIIKNGYWNYYIAFRIKNYAIHLKEIEHKKTFSGVPAFLTDDTCMVSKETSELLEERKATMLDCKEHLDDSVTQATLRELYNLDQLPEFFWDFDDSLNDRLEQSIRDSIEHTQFLNQSYAQMLGIYGKGKCEYYVLMPLKVYFSEWDFIYCRVYIQLFTSGNGMIKLELPLQNVSTEYFAYHPARRWYSFVKAWGALLPGYTEDTYKIIPSNSQGSIMDIFEVLSSYVQKFFSESIIDENRFLGFETFVILESIDCNIHETSQANMENLRQLFHFARPDDFALTPDDKELQQFWSDSYFNASGIHVIKGTLDRLIMYASVDELNHLHGRTGVSNPNEYLQNSISGTYDTFILLALAQKDNDMTVYSLSQQNSHSISHNMVHYYANANYLDSIRILAPNHGTNFYHEVLSILNKSTVDFQEMLNRMQHIEDYEKLHVSERRNRLLQIITLIFTVLFGLPLIYETLSILKRTFHNVSSGVSLFAISRISFIIWLILLFFIVSNCANNYLEYLGCGISNRKPFIFQGKCLFRAAKIILKSVFNK